MATQDKTPAPSPDADARIRFVMNTSGMKVGISQYFPPSGRGLPLSPALILKQLRQAGITADMDQEAAVKACAILASGGDTKSLIIARGTPATEPRDSVVDLAGDPALPVLPGMFIGKVRPCAPGAKGLTADGRELEPQSARVPARLRVGDNIALDRGDASLRSTVYGLIRQTEADIRVEPLVRIAGDDFAVSATLYPADFNGQPLTAATLDEELKRLGVVLKTRAPAVQAALDQAGASGQPQELDIVQGTAPSPGKDGWLELLVTVRETGPVEKDGRIDYSDRGAFPSVDGGMVVAVLHPPSRGVPGMDVFGRPHPASEGRPAEVYAGENVEVDADGVTYRATAPGMLVFEGNVLMVTECLEVRRDVGFATGNIRVEKGSVKILGAVSKGFQVKAPGHVVVADVVESAEVEAGRDVHVRGGIMMPGGGRVWAGGSVNAQYAINARIEAGGDVVITNEVSNSAIRAGGRFIAARGTGAVQGCEIVCGAGAHINELGSPIGAHTVLAVSAKDTQHTDLLKEKRILRRRVRRVNEVLGLSDARTILTRTPEAKRQAVGEILKARIRDQARLEEIAAILAEEQEQRFKALEAASIVVIGTVHPGVVIKFGGRVLKITDGLIGARFFYERRGRGVSMASL